MNNAILKEYDLLEEELEKENGIGLGGRSIPRSYGMLVFREVIHRDGAREIEYLVVRPTQGGRENPYYLPKGGRNKNETARDAAIREVLEETGIRAKILLPLGVVRYKNGRKEICIYLARYTGGKVLEDGRCPEHDQENEDVRFVSEFDAKKMLRYEFRALIDKAKELFRKEN